MFPQVLYRIWGVRNATSAGRAGYGCGVLCWLCHSTCTSWCLAYRVPHRGYVFYRGLSSAALQTKHLPVACFGLCPCFQHLTYSPAAVALCVQKQRQFCGSVPAPNLAAVLAASAPGTGLKEAWLTSGSNASPGSSSSSVQVPIGRTQAAVLTDSSAWLFHPQLGLWVMLAPPAGLASAPAQLAANALPSTATLAPHPDADKLRSARAAVATSQQVQQGVEAVWLRQEAACQLTAAELLGDTLGYQRWLKQLVLLLARQNEPVSFVLDMGVQKCIEQGTWLVASAVC